MAPLVAAVAIMKGAASAIQGLVSLRKFVHDCEEGEDLDKHLKAEFAFWTCKVHGELAMYSKLKDSGRQEEFDRELETLNEMLLSMLGEAENKYRRKIHDKIAGVPVGFWKNNIEFLKDWLSHNERQLDRMRLQVQTDQAQIEAKADGKDFDRLGELAECNPQLKSILNMLEPELETDDLKVIEQIAADPACVHLYKEELIVRSIRAALDQPNGVFLVGSEITTATDRRGEVVRVVCDDDYPFQLCVSFKDGGRPQRDWFKLTETSLKRWGPEKRTVRDAFQDVCFNTVDVQDRRALSMIQKDARNFIKYFQHKQRFCDILARFFERKLQLQGEGEDYVSYVLLGNPGVGKSTILNCLSYQQTGESFVRFSGGTSVGGGLTRFVQWVQVENNRYGDSPGLDDNETRQQCASEMELVLQEDGKYKVFFVITLEALRVKPSDIKTMAVVLDAAPGITNYGLIINKIIPKENDRLGLEEKSNENYIRFMAQFNGLRCLPSTIVAMLRTEDLEGEENAVTELPELVWEAIRSLAPIIIRKKDIQPIDVKDWEEKIEELERRFQEDTDRRIEELKRENDKKHAEVAKLHKEQLEQARQEADAKLAEMVKQAEEKMKVALEDQKEIQDKQDHAMKTLQEELEDQRQLMTVLEKAQEDKERQIQQLIVKQQYFDYVGNHRKQDIESLQCEEQQRVELLEDGLRRLKQQLEQNQNNIELQKAIKKYERALRESVAREHQLGEASLSLQKEQQVLAQKREQELHRLKQELADVKAAAELQGIERDWKTDSAAKLVGTWNHSNGTSITISIEGDEFRIAHGELGVSRIPIIKFWQGHTLHYFGFEGKLEGNTIKWSNGKNWTHVAQ